MLGIIFKNLIMICIAIGVATKIEAEKKTSVAILGAGQVGCYLAALCSNNAEYSVHLLARSNYALLNDQGITLNKNNVSMTTRQFKVYNDIRTMPACDIVIIATDVRHNESLGLKESSLFHKNSCVITVQNGLDFENHLIAQLPVSVPLYSGTSWIKVARTSATHVSHQFGQVMQLSCYNNVSRCDEKIKAFFNEMGLVADIVYDIPAVQITKLALNVPFLLYMVKHGLFFNEVRTDSVLNNQRLAIQDEIEKAAKKLNITIDMEQINNAVHNMIPVANPVVASREQFRVLLLPKVLAIIEPLIQYMHKNGQSLPLLEQEYKAFAAR